jgi:hypothetical protein
MILAMIGAAAAFGAFAHWGDIGNALWWIELGLLGGAVGAMLLDRVDAHVFVRSVLWGVLTVGAVQTIAAGHATRPIVEHARGLALLLGPGMSLLALGRAGLDGEHGSFFPLVMRRSLLTMMVTGLCVAHVLFVMSVYGADRSLPLFAVSLSTPALLVVGVIGLSRTRSWGLFAYVGALLAAAGSVALFLHPPDGWMQPAELIAWNHVLAATWSVFGTAAGLVALPVLAAILVKPRARAPGRPWGQYVHAVLVAGALTAALVLAYT